MKKHKTVIIGLGNYLLADEGAGIRALNMLKSMLKEKPLDLFDGATCGMKLLYQMEEREKIIFIDAGDCGLRPGEFLRFHPEEVVSRKNSNHGYLLHKFDLIVFLKFAKKILNMEKTKVVIFCIQPAEIKCSERLSPEVRKSLPGLVKTVYNEVSADF